MGSDNSSERIKYFVDGPFFVIRLCDPGSLNALNGNDYLYLAELLEKSERDPDVYFTVLQSSGRFFSSGADFQSISQAQEMKTDEPELNKWLAFFVSRNVYITDTFARHSKILICCMNGPAVGLSAALCALCDIVYSMNDKVYLLFPFSSIGLVTEGATSVTLPMKLGSSWTFESLLFSSPIKFDRLDGTIVAKNYEMDNVDKFNDTVLEELKLKIKHLYLPTLPEIKKLLRESYAQELSRANSVEVNDAIKYWVKGIPQTSFKQLSQKQRKHKL
ncbi:hypothetical protein HG537_0G04050 [Torulaspora globosa]|uniref:ClpP/crotonase n=1 Tax=Torulaspora globosa TaxID=48254 RepID=A0A7H9HXN5_9SACH|nr:hypothetical protein HG537_0G04050 [Torulaspora sp. CBS 2947]